jgi:hypothetical protein
VLRWLQYAKVAQTMAQTANIRYLVFYANCHKSVIHFSQLWQFAQWSCALGISQPAQTPSLSKIRWIWRTRFLHQWMLFCMDLSLETADF